MLHPVQIISRIIYVLALARLMGVFFEKKRTHLVVIILSYVFYFSTAFLVVLIYNVHVNFLIASFIGIVLIVLCYESSNVKKVIAVLCTFSFAMIIDLISRSMHRVQFDAVFEANISGALGVFRALIVGILPLILASLFRLFKNVRKRDIPFPMLRIYVLFFSISFPFYLVMFFLIIYVPSFVLFMSTFMLLTLNSLAYYLHHILSAAYDSKVELALQSQEKKYYFSQSQLMQESVERMRAFKHDIKTHLATLQDYSTKGKPEEISAYLDALQDGIKDSETYSETGNIAFDSIINYKLRNAEDDNIKLDLKVAVPPDLRVEAVDIVTILGNLLDNALEALAKVSDDKVLKLDIGYSKGGLFIKVANTFNGKVKYVNDKNEEEQQIATQKDGDGHGYGLRNVRQSVEKYDGFVKISHTEDVFSVGVHLYADDVNSSTHAAPVEV